jgi:hypothetical protein
MSKTSPIVIPVLVDTTGVDRGINNVRNRLRGTSGSQSGFGSGGRASQGVGQAGSGGGVLSAAVAGGVAGRAFGGKGTIRDEIQRQKDYEERRGRLFRDRVARIESTVRAGKRAKEILPPDDPIHGQIGKEFDRQIESMRGMHKRMRGLYRSVFAGMDRRGTLGTMKNLLTGKTAGQFMSGMLGRFGVPGALAGPLGGALGAAALPIGAAAIGAAGSNFKTRQANLFRNFEQFEGTEYYGMARKNAMAYTKTDEIDWMTRFKIREKAAGGAVSGIFETLGTGFDAVSDFVADMFGGAKFETPKAWDANVASGGAIRIKN